MKKNVFLKGIVAGLASVAIIFGIAAASPGSVDDPVVSLGYLETVFMDKVKAYIDQQKQAEVFTVIELTKGQKMWCEAGTEMILRMGQVTVLAPARGGIADTTTGQDLADGANGPANHLLIVPLGDGRGIRAENQVLVMVKGKYRVE